MEITAIEIRDVLRIKHIKFTPPADVLVILIGGDNAQGKTSLQRSLLMAMGGAGEIPDEPVRRGAIEGEIVLQLTDVTVRRRIMHDGQSKLEVTSKYGPIKSPQEWLSKLFGGRALNPLDFLRRKPAEQRDQLLKLIDKDGRIAGIESNRKAVFTRRTEVGRDLKKATAQLAGMTEVQPGSPVDIMALTTESRTLGDVIAEMGRRRNVHEQAMRESSQAASDVKRANDAMEAAKRALEAALARQNAAEESLTKARVAVESFEDDQQRAAARRDEIQRELAAAQVHNSKVAADQAAAAARAKLAAELAETKADYEALDEEIKQYDAQKLEILTAAQLPVPALGVDDNGVTLNGLPFDQASSAERWRVAVGLAIAAKPELRDVWIEDGALLDDNALLALKEIAQRSGYRFWVERVGNKDPGAVIIHDGQIAESEPAASSAQLTIGGVQ